MKCSKRRNCSVQVFVCKPGRNLTMSDQWSFSGPLKDIQSSPNHSRAVLAVCSESLFCCKVNLWPSLRSRVLCIRFLSSLSLYFTTSGFSPIMVNLSVPASIKENKKKLITVLLVLNFWNDGVHCALGNLHCSRTFFCSFPQILASLIKSAARLHFFHL